MAAKPTRLTHKTVIQLHLVTVVSFAVIAPGGQSGNFRIHPHKSVSRLYEYHKQLLYMQSKNGILSSSNIALHC